MKCSGGRRGTGGGVSGRGSLGGGGGGLCRGPSNVPVGAGTLGFTFGGGGCLGGIAGGSSSDFVFPSKKKKKLTHTSILLKNLLTFKRLKNSCLVISKSSK